MTSTPRTRFAVHPAGRAGVWITDHRRLYKRARFGLAELATAVDAVLAAWPVDAGEEVAVGQGPPGLHELVLRRDTLADSVVLLSAAALEAFLNYYGIVRLDEKQFNTHFEMLGPEKKLRVLLLTCDGIAIEHPDSMIAALRTVIGRRNRLAHPKAKRVDRPQTTEDRMGPPLPESVAEVVNACTEFFRLFAEAVPEAAHLVPEWQAGDRRSPGDDRQGGA